MFESNININEELKKCRTMDDLMGKNGLLQRLVGPMVERLLEAELEDKLGYEPHSRAEKNLRIEETEKPVKRYKHHTVQWRYPLLGIEMENLNLR